MEPQTVPLLDAVMADVENRLHVCAQGTSKPFGEELPARLGPTDSEIVARQVTRGQFVIDRFGLMFRGVHSEDLLAEAAGAAVNKQHKVIVVQGKVLEFGRVYDPFNRLQF